MIPLVPIAGVASAYANSAGSTATRDAKGQPFDYRNLRRVDALATVMPEAWRAPRCVVAAITALDAAMKAAGSQGLRLLEARRTHARSAGLRAPYQRWLDAGRPPEGSAGYLPGMRTQYAARPGEDHHNWGGAIDVDVAALDFPKVEPRAQLARFWDLAVAQGFEPVIRTPNAEQPEAEHFNHLGALEQVHSDALHSYPNRAPFGANADTLVAEIGCLLTGTFQGLQSQERLIQARLILVGTPVAITGKLDAATRRALHTHIGPASALGASKILNALDEHQIGLDEMSRL